MEDTDDIIDVIKVVVALLVLFGGNFIKILRKLKEVREGARSPTPRQQHHAEPDAEAPTASWRYDQAELLTAEEADARRADLEGGDDNHEHDEEHEEAHEDEEDYDLRDELDTDLVPGQLEERSRDDDLEDHEEDAHPDRAVAMPSLGEIASSEEWSEASEGETVEESAPAEESEQQRVAHEAVLARNRANQRAYDVPAGASHHPVVRAASASFLRDAVVLDLLLKRKVSNPLFRLREGRPAHIPPQPRTAKSRR